MSNKLKYYPDRNGEPVEFNQNAVRILLPNGDEFILQYDHRLKALDIQKSYSDGDSAITITPQVSNHIIRK